MILLIEYELNDNENPSMRNVKAYKLPDSTKLSEKINKHIFREGGSGMRLFPDDYPDQNGIRHVIGFTNTEVYLKQREAYHDLVDQAILIEIRNQKLKTVLNG